MENRAAMKLAEARQCTGCGACMKACPKGAIRFAEDNEGFPGPVIDEASCVHCGICSSVCPILRFPDSGKTRKSYAVQLSDQEALRNSTSGGVFIALAREILRKKGIVYGCIWDDDYNARVVGAENEEELLLMQGSKYVWSWAGDSYPEIKRNLEDGKYVMFTGLPCQAAGLKNYLRKEYERLYIISFFCGGAPSPYAFQEYLKTITGDTPKKELDFKFRDKSKYGVGVNISFNSRGRRVYQSYVENPYFFSYHTKVFHRKSCYKCAFRYEDRVEDLTFGDYWGVGKYHQEFRIQDGVSAVLINSDKGQELFDSVKNDVVAVESNIENIARGNNLTLGDKRKEFALADYRDDFFRILHEKGWRAAERSYLYNKTRVRLLIKGKTIGKLKHVVKKFIKQ